MAYAQQLSPELLDRLIAQYNADRTKPLVFDGITYHVQGGGGYSAGDGETGESRWWDGTKENLTDVLGYAMDPASISDGQQYMRYRPQNGWAGTLTTQSGNGWFDDPLFNLGAMAILGGAAYAGGAFGGAAAGAGEALSVAGDAVMPGALGAGGVNMPAVLPGLEGYLAGGGTGALTGAVSGGSAAGEALPAFGDAFLPGQLGAGGVNMPSVLPGLEGYLAPAGGSGATNALTRMLSGGGSGDWSKYIGPGLSAAGSIYGASAAQSAAETQANAQREAAALSEPWRQAGMQGLNRLTDMLGISGRTGAEGYGSLMKDFGMSDFQADPGYQFRMDEGNKALERSAAARGGLLSGRAAKDTMRFSQGLASQEYGNAYNRFQTNRANKLNPLQSIAGVGQSAANTIGGYTSNAGDAQAAGRIGAANAITGGIGQGWSMYQGQQNADRENALMAAILGRRYA